MQILGSICRSCYALFLRNHNQKNCIFQIKTNWYEMQGPLLTQAPRILGLRIINPRIYKTDAEYVIQRKYFFKKNSLREKKYRAMKVLKRISIKLYVIYTSLSARKVCVVYLIWKVTKIVLVLIWRNRSTFEFLCPSPLEWTLQAGICLRRQILPPHSPAHSPANPEENKSNAKIDDGKNCLEKEILLSTFNVFLLINE